MCARCPPLRLTLLPFVWTENNDQAAVTLVRDIHPGHEILWQTNNLLPVGDIEITKHGTVTIDSNNAFAVLNEVTRIRAIEEGAGHWMGLLPEPEGAGGVAYIGGKTSMSQLTESTIAHELGHNFNLFHADCGGAAGPDPTFPWPNGSIGAWGYDPRDGGSLVPPDWADMMSYCPPEWISDYYFTNSLRYRLDDEGAPPSRTPGAGRSLLVSGRVSADGTPRLDPAFVIDAAPRAAGRRGAVRAHGAGVRTEASCSRSASACRRSRTGTGVPPSPSCSRPRRRGRRSWRACRSPGRAGRRRCGRGASRRWRFCAIR